MPGCHRPIDTGYCLALFFIINLGSYHFCYTLAQPPMIFSFLASVITTIGVSKKSCSDDLLMMKSQKPLSPLSLSTVKSIPEKKLIFSCFFSSRNRLIIMSSELAFSVPIASASGTFCFNRSAKKSLISTSLTEENKSSVSTIFRLN